MHKIADWGGTFPIGSRQGWANHETLEWALRVARRNNTSTDTYVAPILVETGLARYVMPSRVCTSVTARQLLERRVLRGQQPYRLPCYGQPALGVVNAEVSHGMGLRRCALGGFQSLAQRRVNFHALVDTQADVTQPTETLPVSLRLPVRLLHPRLWARPHGCSGRITHLIIQKISHQMPISY